VRRFDPAPAARARAITYNAVRSAADGGDVTGLERFTAAQGGRDDGFEAALRELRSGRKQGHWIWYIFPQLSGLGSSALASAYGIRGVDEAAEYLRHPLLRERLLTATTAVLGQLRRSVGLDELMGSHIDVLKLVSSLTLFQPVASALLQSDGVEDHRLLADAADEVLTAAAAQGLPRCAYTLDRLREQSIR
jgi:uncharacterized protein (DUF1810 family)